jgi:hypothetical protein
MSTRPVSAAATLTFAGDKNRLNAVLKAGLNNGAAPKTDVLLVPADPRFVIPLPIPQPQIDPFRLVNKDGAELTPALFDNLRRTFPQSLQNVLPTDRPDRIDPYGNRMVFERDGNKEVLRKIILEGHGNERPWTEQSDLDRVCRPSSERGASDVCHTNVFGGTLEFNGPSGNEYAVRWTGGNSLEDVIDFDGTDPDSQTIESASLSLTTLKEMGYKYPPVKENADVFKLR